jgi:hypothetical protein
MIVSTMKMFKVRGFTRGFTRIRLGVDVGYWFRALMEMIRYRGIALIWLLKHGT